MLYQFNRLPIQHWSYKVKEFQQLCLQLDPCLQARWINVCQVKALSVYTTSCISTTYSQNLTVFRVICFNQVNNSQKTPWQPQALVDDINSKEEKRVAAKKGNEAISKGPVFM